jgi:hypothetical protein
MKAKRTSNSRSEAIQPRSVRMKQVHVNSKRGTGLNTSEYNMKELPLIVDSTKEHNENTLLYNDEANLIKEISISPNIQKQTLDNDSINKKLRQKEYMEQLQEQIREKERIRQEQTILQYNFHSTAVGHYWKYKEQFNVPVQEPRAIQKSVASITGSRRGQVQNRIDVSA